MCHTMRSHQYWLHYSPESASTSLGAIFDVADPTVVYAGNGRYTWLLMDAILGRLWALYLAATRQHSSA